VGSASAGAASRPTSTISTPSIHGKKAARGTRRDCAVRPAAALTLILGSAGRRDDVFGRRDIARDILEIIIYHLEK
jgi:hypothetical protein